MGCISPYLLNAPVCAKAAVTTTPPSLDLTIRYRGLEVDHYTGTEEVAALSKSNVSLCLSQVPWGNYRQLRRKHGWLFGNQQIDIFGRKDNSVAYCHRHFRNLPVATSQHFSNLTFGDTDAKLIGPGHPPLAGDRKSVV